MTSLSAPKASYSRFNGYIIDASLVVTDISLNSPFSKISKDMYVYSTKFDSLLVEIETQISNIGTTNGLTGTYIVDISQNIYSESNPGPFISTIIPHGTLLAGTDVSYSTITVAYDTKNKRPTCDGNIMLGMDVSGTNIPSGTKIANYATITNGSYTHAGVYILSQSVGSSFILTGTQAISCNVKSFSWYGCIGVDGSTNMIVFDSPNRVNENSTQLSKNGVAVPFTALMLSVDVSANGLILPSTDNVGTKIINMPSACGGFGKYTLNHGPSSIIGARFNGSVFTTTPSGETRLLVDIDINPVVGTINVGDWVGFESGPPSIRNPEFGGAVSSATFTYYTLKIMSGPNKSPPFSETHYFYVLSGGPSLPTRIMNSGGTLYSGPLIEGVLLY